MSQVLCVTGMHRSGTSLTANWLLNCGLSLSDGNLYGADDGNVNGHFEDADFADIQSAMIRRLASRSHGWIVGEGFQGIVDEVFKSQAAEIIIKRNDRFGIWGWKDPRTTLFLDYWKSILPEMKVVFLWRECPDVAMSLVDRARRVKNKSYRVSSKRAVEAWCRYNQSVVEFVSRHPESCVLFKIPDLVECSRSACDHVVNHLGINLEFSSIKEIYSESHMRLRQPSFLVKRFAKSSKVANLTDSLTGLQFDLKYDS